VTVTDANLILGRLGPDTLLGGTVRLDGSRVREVRRAVAGQLAGPLDMDPEEAAAGVIRIAENQMAEAIRALVIQGGHDLRRFMLLAYGGAGPMHAASLVARLGIAGAVVPPMPGAFSAWGLLNADLQADFVRTRMLSLTDCRPVEDTVAGIFAELEEKAEAWLLARRAEGSCMDRFVDLRYRGQDFELRVPVPPGPVNAELIDQVIGAFHTAHGEHYGFQLPDQPVQSVNFRVTARGELLRTALEPVIPPPTRLQHATPSGYRPVFFPEAAGFINCPIYRRHHLLPGTCLPGPAVVEQPDATTVIGPGQELMVDPWGNIIITAGEAPERGCVPS